MRRPLLQRQLPPLSTSRPSHSHALDPCRQQWLPEHYSDKRLAARTPRAATLPPPPLTSSATRSS